MTTMRVSSRIVVGVDGSEQSKQALRWAGQIAKSYGAHIEVLGAWQYPVSYGWSTVAVDWDPQQDTTKCVTEAVDEVFGPDRPQDLQIIVQEGGAAKLLVDHSAGALMLVVGSRGHGGFTGLLLGSVSASVAEHATCPVLVVHGNDAPKELSA